MKTAGIDAAIAGYRPSNAEPAPAEAEKPGSRLVNGLRMQLNTFARWSAASPSFWPWRMPRCAGADCIHSRTLWRRLRPKRRGVWMQGAWYCLDACLEPRLADAVRKARAVPPRSQPSHRVPLGLLLLSRQHVTVDQLHAALGAQRQAGCGRIGEWLQRLGFVTEHEVTAALARQWSCPVLRATSAQRLAFRRLPRLPISLLESSRMVPVDYVETTRTLHVAFGGRIDYSVLYAIEQMLECRTEPCLTTPSSLAHSLEGVSAARREHNEREVVFDAPVDAAASARIIASYAAYAAPDEIRLAACGPYFWVRLLGIGPRRYSRSLDLLLAAPGEPAALTHSSITASSAAF